MQKKRFTEEQIGFALRQAESGTTVGDVCRKMGVTEATYTGGRGSSPEWGSRRSAS